MNADHFQSRAKFFSALHDTDCDPGARRRMVRTAALQQVRWQPREWERVLAAHSIGSLRLVAPRERANLHGNLDLLRTAGDEFPLWLYWRGSLVRSTDAAGGIAVDVSLISLLAYTNRVLAWFDAAPPGTGISSSPPWLGADAAVVSDDA